MKDLTPAQNSGIAWLFPEPAVDSHLVDSKDTETEVSERAGCNSITISL